LPGTDVALFNGMLHLCLWEELTDTVFIAAHTEGFAELRQTVRDYTLRWSRKPAALRKPIYCRPRWFGGSAASLSLYCQGLNQSSSGTAKMPRADQSASGNASDRQTRCRAVFADRTTECDGRA
jgi:assimilatory nitrate reductase catalytic subunit